jgi:hypothetical protein
MFKNLPGTTRPVFRELFCSKVIRANGIRAEVLGTESIENIGSPTSLPVRLPQLNGRLDQHFLTVMH